MCNDHKPLTVDTQRSLHIHEKASLETEWPTPVSAQRTEPPAYIISNTSLALVPRRVAEAAFQVRDRSTCVLVLILLTV